MEQHPRLPAPSKRSAGSAGEHLHGKEGVDGSSPVRVGRLTDDPVGRPTRFSRVIEARAGEIQDFASAVALGSTRLSGPGQREGPYDAHLQARTARRNTRRPADAQSGRAELERQATRSHLAETGCSACSTSGPAKSDDDEPVLVVEQVLAIKDGPGRGLALRSNPWTAPAVSVACRNGSRRPPRCRGGHRMRALTSTE